MPNLVEPQDRLGGGGGWHKAARGGGGGLHNKGTSLAQPNTKEGTPQGGPGEGGEGVRGGAPPPPCRNEN